MFFTLCCSLALQGILQSNSLAGQFVSQGTWAELVGLLGGEVAYLPEAGTFAANPGFWPIFLANVVSGLIVWAGGAGAISLRTKISYPEALGRWGLWGWLWGVIPAAWELGRIFAPLFGSNNVIAVFLHATVVFWMAAALAGWLATFATLLRPQPSIALRGDETKKPRSALWAVGIAALIYVVIYTAMNWQLYRNLLVPHGDSAMYEEHLWNLMHGKGFRSYQEDRLFLGEHIQVVHLLLLPFHFVWPSLMMMDLWESIALASAAIPIYWITKRHSDSSWMGVLVAGGYLCYFPMQFVDIAIDLKTFRPIAFGIPAMLYGLDQLERGRTKTALLCWLIALSAKEDYAIILAPLGLWIAFCASPPESRENPSAKRRLRWLGIGLAVFSTAYLILAVKYIIPWFRSGEEVHYVGYFRQFGSTLEEVATNILSNPKLLFSELFAVSSWVFAAALLVPLGGMALFSPSRVLVAAPSFGILCLNQIDKTPQHHFHAPLIPILFWATAAGVGRFPRFFTRDSSAESKNRTPSLTSEWAAGFVLASAFSTGLFFSMGPLGIGFWDPHASLFWKDRYLIQERAKKFALIANEIPKSARVFSTDFVHPRFTHHARSYDYSSYDRATDEELTNPVPGETYYLVIDTQHPYSKIKTSADIPEYREHPDDWELLPDRTAGYFIILKRRN